MKFRATRKAFYNASRVKPGQVFDAPDDFTAPWAEPVSEDTEPAPVEDVEKAQESEAIVPAEDAADKSKEPAKRKKNS